jgi:hypothetical protein
MTVLRQIVVGALVLLCFGLTSARADEAEQMKLELMQSTKVIAAMGLSGPADRYLSDGDPDTLEIVFMAKPEDGPSHVSDDGEVIFLSPHATDAEQSDLIGKAFDIRVQRRLATKASN